jgi:hypothetical protein
MFTLHVSAYMAIQNIILVTLVTGTNKNGGILKGTAAGKYEKLSGCAAV